MMKFYVVLDLAKCETLLHGVDCFNVDSMDTDIYFEKVSSRNTARMAKNITTSKFIREDFAASANCFVASESSEKTEPYERQRRYMFT